MKSYRKVQLRVGIFIVMALVVGGGMVYVIGQRRHLFSSMVSFRMKFNSVEGLTEGSPVRVAGVAVGTTRLVKFAEDGRIIVKVEVMRDARNVVRAGAVATIGNKGLLGDKLVDISVGLGPPLKSGSWIPTKEEAGLLSYMKKADAIIEDVATTVSNLRSATDPLASGEFGRDLQTATRSFGEVMNMVSTGDGLLPRLINDKQLAEDVTQSVANTRTITGALQGVTENLRAISRRVVAGPGLAHSMIYDPEAKELVENLAMAAQKLNSALEGVKEGGATGGALTDLGRVAENLRVITDEVREGRGSLGAIISDPSLYEDLKRVVGNLERNEVLRALVRHSIRNDEKRPTAKATSR